MKPGLLATKELFGHTRRTLRLVWASSPSLLLYLSGLSVAGAVLPLAMAYAGKRIIDAVVQHSRPLTLDWVALELLFVALSAATQRAQGLVRSLLGARLGTDVNVQILDKALRLDLSFFEDAEFYDKLTRARREASSRPVALLSESFALVQNVITLLGYAVMLAHFSAWIVLGLLLATLPATLSEMRYSKIAFSDQKLAFSGVTKALVPGVRARERRAREGGQAVRYRATPAGALPNARRIVLRRRQEARDPARPTHALVQPDRHLCLLRHVCGDGSGRRSFAHHPRQSDAVRSLAASRPAGLPIGSERDREFVRAQLVHVQFVQLHRAFRGE